MEGGNQKYRGLAKISSAVGQPQASLIASGVSKRSLAPLHTNRFVCLDSQQRDLAEALQTTS